ncbi:MAG: hypothetical protein FWB74_03550 [Defluviitaleaceae bacterium]|nr:hypothetical protein [Defluviitaleaceae bacterium]
MIMDWLERLSLELPELLIVLIGSFFGFLFALGAAVFIAWLERRNRVKRMEKNIKAEFTRLLDSICNFLDSNDNKGMLYLDTPLWNSLVSNGDMLMLLKSNKNKMEDFGKVLRIYAKIHTLGQINAYRDNNDQKRKLITEIADEIKTYQNIGGKSL